MSLGDSSTDLAAWFHLGEVRGVSLASHTLRREEGSGHAAAEELLLDNKMLTSTKHVT